MIEMFKNAQKRVIASLRRMVRLGLVWPSSRRIQADIQYRRAVGEPADGDEVDAGLSNASRSLGRHAAGGLADRAAADHCDGALEIVERHVVEQYRVNTDAERF